MQNKLIARSFILFTTCILYAIKAECGATKTTLLDINAQSEHTLSGMKVRLQLDGVQNGPKDFLCVNKGRPFVKKDSQGDLLKDTDYVFVHQEPYRQRTSPIPYSTSVKLSPEVASSIYRKSTVINAWGTVSYTKRLVGSDLEDLFDGRSAALQRWRSQQPVKLYALDNSSYNNAYFSPDTSGGSIHFFPLKMEQNGKRVTIGWTSNDFETASHETGHNISHILRPNNDFSRPQTGAIDESFGDFIALSAALSLKPIRERFLQDTGRNLRKTSFLSEMSESLSKATGLGVHGIRNALNDLTLGDVRHEVHDLSRVLTGTLYDTLVIAFEEECPSTWFGGLLSCSSDQKDSGILAQMNKDLRQLVLKTHASVRYNNPSFADYGYTMHQITTQDPNFSYLEQPILAAFEERGIDISIPHHSISICDNSALKQYGKGGFRDHHICGTLQHRLKY